MRGRVGQSVWYQMERLGHVFSIHHTFKCSAPPAPILFDISLPLILSGVPQTSLVARVFGAEGVNGGYYMASSASGQDESNPAL